MKHANAVCRADEPAARVLAVNRFYWPDHSATAQILTDLCAHLADTGVAVTVVTSRKRYDDPKARLAARETRDGVQIHRVWTTRLGRDWAPARAVDYASFYLSAMIAMLRLAGRGDVILAKTDPPLISVAAWMVARIRGARLVNWLQDVFPEVAGALGMRWARGPGGTLLQRLRNLSLDAATANVVISEAMAARLAGEGVRPASLHVIRNWSCERIRPVAASRNPLRRDWGLEGRFTIGYSGNLGRAHAAPAVADLVRRTAGIDGLTWLFIGGGKGLDAVRRAAAETGADIRFQPYQPRERLSESLSAPDMHLVCLDPACEGLIMPSKLYGVLAAGRGVIALGARDGAVAQEVVPAGCGVALDIAAPESWAAAVRRIATPDVAARLGAQARAQYEAEHGAAGQLAAWRATLLSARTDNPASAEGMAAAATRAP